jgi:hypothetical protein
VATSRRTFVSMDSQPVFTKMRRLVSGTSSPHAYVGFLTMSSSPPVAHLMETTPKSKGCRGLIDLVRMNILAAAHECPTTMAFVVETATTTTTYAVNAHNRTMELRHGDAARTNALQVAWPNQTAIANLFCRTSSVQRANALDTWPNIAICWQQRSVLNVT